jgi:hypothetical protein
MNVVERQAQLLQVVGASHTVGGFANLLHGGKEQTDQNCDDGDYHQQFNQGKTLPIIPGHVQTSLFK